MHRYRLFLRRHRWKFIIGLVVLLLIVAGVVWLSHRHGPVINDFKSCVEAGYAVSTTDPQTCSANHQTFVGPSSSPPSSTSTGFSGTNQTYQILAEGDSRGDYPAKQQVISDQATWTTFWNQLFAKISPMPPLLPVDFSQNEVIALTDGVKPNNNYLMEMTGVLVGSSSSQVDYQEITPGAGCKVSATPSNYYILAVTAKTTGPVSFVATPQSRKC